MANVDDYAYNSKANYVADWNILEKEHALAALCKFAKLVVGFPPCTDLAVSGAMFFEAKRAANPYFQHEALHLFRSVERIATWFGTPWIAENPVSVVASLYRKPNHVFNPFEYGGYLPENDQHPDYPKYIAPRDAYPKKTCLWSSRSFVMPPKRPVPCPPGYSAQHRLLGGKSAKTKRIRSASPRGFFVALAEQYSKSKIIE